MGWSLGWDSNWKRDIGYGVPAHCDHPGCTEEIDRGLSYVCGAEPYGGETGCGLYFCCDHQFGYPQLCGRCDEGAKPFEPTEDLPEWLNWKLNDESWKEWRESEPLEVAKIIKRLGKLEIE